MLNHTALVVLRTIHQYGRQVRLSVLFAVYVGLWILVCRDNSAFRTRRAFHYRNGDKEWLSEDNNTTNSRDVHSYSANADLWMFCDENGNEFYHSTSAIIAVLFLNLWHIEMVCSFRKLEYFRQLYGSVNEYLKRCIRQLEHIERERIRRILIQCLGNDVGNLAAEFT